MTEAINKAVNEAAVKAGRNPLRDDGLFYCGSCGENAVERTNQMCEKCQKWCWFDGTRCGVCGAPATFFFVHGFRCKAHEFQVEPSDAIITDNFVAVLPGLRGKC